MRLKVLVVSAIVAAVAAATIYQPASAVAAVRAKGFTRKNGTRVGPSMRSAPDKSKKNNFSSKDRTNPYNGKRGTK